jgi:arylsulfatase A
MNASTPSPAARPNLVYIYVDDMGIGDASCYNPRCAWSTPALDRLAAEGRRFTDAHSASALCTPSRYALLTGRYAWRTPMKRGVLRGYSEPLLAPDRLTVADLLRQAGYHTAMLGKWHLGFDWRRTGPAVDDVDFAQPLGGGPLAHGFDRFYGISASLDMPPYVFIEQDRVESVPTTTIGDSPKPKMWRAGFISDGFEHERVLPELERRALDYIRERTRDPAGQPFFLYVALASPHTPIVPTPEFIGRSRATVYGDFVMQTDAMLGKVMAELDAAGAAENTLVIFTSDNGFAPAANLEELQALGHDPSGGFRGHKADIYEGGHRIPFVARWPARVPAGSTCNAPMAQADLMATCAEWLGVELPDGAGEDSVSILDLLTGAAAPTVPRVPLVHHSENGSFAIRDGRWKLCLCPGSGGWSFPRPGVDPTDGLPPFQLFDLGEDPGERNNLAAAHPEEVQRLGRALIDCTDRGRSTPGAPQANDPVEAWPQLAWREAFAG